MRRGVVFVGGAWEASDVVVCVSKIVEKPVPALRRPPNPRERQGGGVGTPGQKKLSPRVTESSEADRKIIGYRDSNARGCGKNPPRVCHISMKITDIMRSSTVVRGVHPILVGNMLASRLRVSGEIATDENADRSCRTCKNASTQNTNPISEESYRNDARRDCCSD